MKQIKHIHSKKQIDLFFSYFYDACVCPEIIEEIKKLGIKTMNWFCNASYQFNLVEEISPHYNWCLVPEKFKLDDYRKIGANPFYFQEAANPNVYKDYGMEMRYDVSFIGQAYGERPSYINYLAQNNVDIKVGGYGWDRFISRNKKFNLRNSAGRIKMYLKNKITGNDNIDSLDHKLDGNIYKGILSDRQMIETYNTSKINLGFSSCGETHIDKRILQIRLRDFEIPISKGFYMVEYMEELEDYFDIGREIVCYDSKEDLLDKIGFYLSHESLRNKIREAGYLRCRGEHTWQKRFEKLFVKLRLA